jgi:hypothetical protein
LKSDGKRLQKFTDRYLGQASITSRDVLIEKIGANTGFKLSFTSPSIKELASSFRMDGHQSSNHSLPGNSITAGTSITNNLRHFWQGYLGLVPRIPEGMLSKVVKRLPDPSPPPLLPF